MGFSELLLDWYGRHHRPLPWRETKDAYKIWISEVILQQTRVDQGLGYYLNFVDAFPDVFRLAAASEESVLKLWQGLGYYSRARNLHKAAKLIVTQHKGRFPDSYDDALRLPGVGPYTAAAILSIAYNKVFPVVDGNVLRVIARFLAIRDAVDKKAGRVIVDAFLDESIDQESPGDFNQAMMELGALICKPANPDCNICPLTDDCSARKLGEPTAFPLKSQGTVVRTRHFHYLVILELKQRYVYLHKRTADDIWKNLYDFPMIEAEKELNLADLKKTKEWKALFRDGNPKLLKLSNRILHKLSHRELSVVFIALSIQQKLAKSHGLKRVSYEEIGDYPFPVLISKYFSASSLPVP